MKSFSTLVFTALTVKGLCQSLPVVDLSYEIHQALSYNVSDSQHYHTLSHLVRMPIRPTVSTTSDMRNLL